MLTVVSFKRLSHSIALALSFALVLAIVAGVIENERPLHVASDLEGKAGETLAQGIL